MLGVNLKVIKALESGNGNPGFASIEKIAEAFGLAVVFVKKDTVAEILDGEARAREKARSREADAVALAAGMLSEQQLNAKNALKIGRMGFKIPPP
jgi:transcriptional regulator with XRE-family HTH domain